MLRLAWRNLWRNRMRTSIVLLVVSLSYALMLVNLGIGDAAHAKMGEAALRAAGGSILVHSQGYWDSQSSEAVVANPDAVLQALEGIEGVEHTIPRVLINGLVSSSRGSSGVRLAGISPEDEAALADPARFLVEGSFLADAADHPLVLGRSLVEDLDVEIGDRVVLTATDVNGEVTRALFHLTGILDSGSDLDGLFGYTSLAAAQEAVGMDARVTQIGIILDSDAHRRAVRDALQARLGEGAQALELLTWDEAIPEMVGLIEVDDAFGYIYTVVIFVVVGFGIANTFLMSVLERVRELGLLGALGLGPGRVVRLILTESVVLGLLALAIGFALGLAGHLYLAEHGLDLRDLYGMDLEVAGVTIDDLMVRSRITPSKWIVGTAGVLILFVLTALYPAWRAVRLDPAKAMRTFQ